MATEAGYQTVLRLGAWKGHTAYSPDFTDDLDHCIGLPEYILHKEGQAPRWATYEEASEIMKTF